MIMNSEDIGVVGPLDMVMIASSSEGSEYIEAQGRDTTTN